MPKGRTKGQKEIDRDNLETLGFYLKVSVAANAFHLLYLIIFSYIYFELQYWTIFWVVFALVHHGGGHWMLRYLARTGSDLQTSWISEYSKDIILFVSILQILCLVSNKLWLLWVVLPGFAFYKLWTVLLWPWFTAGSEPLDEKDSKKQKKIKNRKFVH